MFTRTLIQAYEQGKDIFIFNKKRFDVLRTEEINGKNTKMKKIIYVGKIGLIEENYVPWFAFEIGCELLATTICDVKQLKQSQNYEFTNAYPFTGFLSAEHAICDGVMVSHTRNEEQSLALTKNMKI